MQEVPKIPTFAAGTILLEYYNLGKINSVPPDATAFRRTTKASVVVVVVWNESKPENDLIAREYTHDAIDILRRGQSAMTISESLGYANLGMFSLFKLSSIHKPDLIISDSGEDNNTKLVFAENYPRLQKIKRKYDPDLIFNKWFPITPA
jgi:hypothetical protein